MTVLNVNHVIGKDRSENGGERGIRTLDELSTHTPLAGERLQPLGHLSGDAHYNQIIDGVRWYWFP